MQIISETDSAVAFHKLPIGTWFTFKGRKLRTVRLKIGNLQYMGFNSDGIMYTNHRVAEEYEPCFVLQQVQSGFFKITDLQSVTSQNVSTK